MVLLLTVLLSFLAMTAWGFSDDSPALLRPHRARVPAFYSQTHHHSLYEEPFLA